MTVNTKDNIEYAAAMLSFVEEPWFEENEIKMPYVHNIMDFFQRSIVSLLGEIIKNKPLGRGIPPFENLTEQTADYLVFCALGTLITVEKPEPPKDLATMFSNTLQAEAVDAFRPSDELTANFSALYTHWLDWFIHRNGAEAGEKYNFFPPITMTAEQKRQWTQWTMYNWDEFESEKTKAMRSAFDALIKDNSQPHLMAAIRGAQQKQQQRLRLIRNSF